MEERTIGPYVVQQQIVLDPEGEVIYYKIDSPLFNGVTLTVMSEQDLTQELIQRHLQVLNVTS
jgi:hypothetical protein